MDNLNQRTLQMEARDCLAAQDAVNVSGVVNSFHRALSTLWNEAHKLGEGTIWVNSHPIVALYLDKLVSLSGTTRNMSRDWQEVKLLAEPPVRFRHIEDAGSVGTVFSDEPGILEEIPGDGPRFPKAAFVTPDGMHAVKEVVSDVVPPLDLGDPPLTPRTVEMNPYEPYEEI